jgi:recombinational DNA repair protein RecT
MATAAKPAATATAPKFVFPTADAIGQQLVVLQPEFQKAEAAGMPVRWEAELGFASDIVLKSDNLKVSTPESLVAAMRNILHVGLTLNPIKHHCTIIPAWNKNLGRFEAQFRPMYRGLVYLGTQAGVHDIVADVVYQADSFEVERRSDGDWFVHKINVTAVRGVDGNPFVGAYVSARMPNSGGRKVEWVPADDIFTMRAQSDSYLRDGQPNPMSPWVKWFDEQAKKSALNRASKRWEEAMDHSTAWQRFQTAVNLEYQAEGGGRTLEHEAPKPPLSLEQVTFIESKVAGIPGLQKPPKYIAKICAAYGKQALSELPADKYQEILERVETTRKQMAEEALKKGGKPAAAK